MIGYILYGRHPSINGVEFLQIRPPLMHASRLQSWITTSSKLPLDYYLDESRFDFQAYHEAETGVRRSVGCLIYNRTTLNVTDMSSSTVLLDQVLDRRNNSLHKRTPNNARNTNMP